jgi:hypothetical protein
MEENQAAMPGLAIQRVFRLNPRYKENAAALAKLDSYRRPVINSLSANLDRFGFVRQAPRAKSLEEILNEPEENDDTKGSDTK